MKNVAEIGMGIRRCGTVLVLMLFVPFIIAPTGPPDRDAPENQAIMVSCYKGNTEQGNFVGNITVSVRENGGRDCDSSFPICDEKCLGCFFDLNSSKNICYDRLGRIPAE